MEDPQALSDLLEEDTDDDFNYEEVDVMRCVENLSSSRL